MENEKPKYVHKKISMFGESIIERQSKKRRKMIWRAISYYWNVYLKERYKIQKQFPEMANYEIIQKAVIDLFGKEKVLPILDNLLELGYAPHPFNTIIYQAANNGVTPTEKERIHDFCLGCIVNFGEDYKQATLELLNDGIIEKTQDKEWIDYLKKCGSFVPEIESAV
ncbi:MAG: hypothetical protein ACE5KE_13325 [Methanosarcinales archaeon]